MSSTADERTIPVLDFSRYEADPASRKEFIEGLRRAARDVGFFYLTGHGITQSLIDDVLGASRRFFALPDEGPPSKITRRAKARKAKTSR